MNAQLSLSQISDEADAIARDAQSTFGRLNAEQLNWKPSAEQWSVAQCLDHLIAANRAFFPAFDKAINGTKQSRFVERLPLLSGFWGWLLIKSLMPDNKQKLKAPSLATPSASAIDPGIVGQLVAHQQEVIGKMKAIETGNLVGVIMTSPFVGFITYSLLDACRIIVVHERRHFAQAERVMAMDSFPK
jgi:hypothetical protein